VGNYTLAFVFSSIFVLALNPCTMVNTQTSLFDERMIWTPQFRRYHAKTSPIISTISLLYSNLNTSPLLRMFDNESLNKVISSPSTPFVEVLPVTEKRIIVLMDLNYTRSIENQCAHVTLFS